MNAQEQQQLHDSVLESNAAVISNDNNETLDLSSLQDQQHQQQQQDEEVHDLTSEQPTGDDQQHEQHELIEHDQQQDVDPSAFPSTLEGIMSQEHALALQHLHAIQGALPLINPPNFPRPTVKRRKPVKWETWEEKNLIEGVRRVSPIYYCYM